MRDTPSPAIPCGCDTFFPMVIRQIRITLFALGAYLFAAGYLAAQGPQFNIQDLGTLPGLSACNGTVLSQSGMVAGYCTSQPGQDLLVNSPATHVFLYANGAMKDLGVSSPQPAAFPTGVNDTATVVGGAFTVADLSNITEVGASPAPFFYQNGQLQPVPAGYEQVLPLGLNNAGQTASSTLTLTPGSYNLLGGSSAFILPVSGAVITLDGPGGPFAQGTNAAFGISSNGSIAGASIEQGAANTTPVLWNNTNPQAAQLLSNYQNAIATSINDSGVAAGVAFNMDLTLLADPNATSHAVLFNNGSVTDLGVLPGDSNSIATSINNSGSVVGFSSSAPPTFTLNLASVLSPPGPHDHAFIYIPNLTTGKMYDLNDQLVNGSGWQLSYAAQINNAGQIVGTGLINGAQHAFLLTPVLSPSVGSAVGAAFSTPSVKTISSNGVFTIFGSELANAGVSQTLEPGDIVNNQLPTQLGGTCVESGNTKWSLFYVSPGQLNVLAGQVPTSGSVPVKVITNCGTANEEVSLAVNVPVADVAPEFLYYLETSTGVNPVIAYDVTMSTYVGPPALVAGIGPARPGDVLTAYGVGWGPTDPPATIGTLAAGIASLPSGAYSLTLGGKPVDISYIGLSPGSAGLYQLNFTVPSGVPIGYQPLVLTVQGVATTLNAYVNMGK